MRKRKTECPHFVGDIRRDGTFPLLFLFRPAHYSILLKHPDEAAHHTRIPSKECFPSSIFTVQKRRLQSEGALENCYWWSTLWNTLPYPGAHTALSHPLHPAGCKHSHFSPDLITCVIMWIVHFHFFH